MRKIFDKLEIVNHLILMIIKAFVFTLFIFVILIISVNVVLRYIFKNPLFWVTELSCYCLVYLVFFGAVLALYHGEHVCINFNKEKLSAVIKNILGYFNIILSFAFIGVIVFGGFKLALSNMQSYTGTLRIPMGYVYMAAPLSGIFMVPLYLEKVIKGVKK